MNQIEPELQTLSDTELKERSKKLQANSLQEQTEITSKNLVESFALVREASRRTLGFRHYDTQLLGGLVLNDCKIAEMRTGEGKTLVATAPAFANALSGKGVHIVTVNEYLAQRDADWMGQVYRHLGLQVGLVQSKMKSPERRKNYNQDITYITNSELGFDFLKDNLVTHITDVVQRPFHYCIVDEVDSILIDEARTPLIISGSYKVDITKIIKATEVSKFLSEGQHYLVDQKAKNISLTDLGVIKAQKLLKVKNIYNQVDPWIPFLLNALRARVLFLKDIHYIVKKKGIIIVDEFTGRVMEGRKWAEGLHGAIEVKENIYNMQSNETIASITYQNFFRLYPKIAGMTGTAKTEELEFENIYNLSVSVLPTFKPIKRADLADAIYIDEITKWKAVAQECVKMYELGRPVLVGTTTIQNTEILSWLLQNSKVSHALLNAKPENIKRESEIIAQAGCLFSVTIATNMAGRGTDILLGGNPEFKAYRQTIQIFEAIINNKPLPYIPYTEPLITYLNEYRVVLIKLQKNLENVLNVSLLPNKELNKFERVVVQLYKKILTYFQNECKKEREKVLELGGLYVIGTERHESRRIDNQLRGRAGRQGDPGTSRFFLSLNDPLLRTFGGDKIKAVMQAFEMEEEALESKFLSQSLDSAQQKVEGYYYDQRKNLNKYDKILDKQRSFLYKFRKDVLISSTLREVLLAFARGVLNDWILPIKKEKLMIAKPIYSLLRRLNFSIETTKNHNIIDQDEFQSLLSEQFWSVYSSKECNYGFYDGEVCRIYEKLVVLKYIDTYWSKHLKNMDLLQEAVTWQTYAQKDPFMQYEEQASALFNRTFKQCRDAIISHLLSIEMI
jgi:preprotein translocase subunit SecA